MHGPNETGSTEPPSAAAAASCPACGFTATTPPAPDVESATPPAPERPSTQDGESAGHDGVLVGRHLGDDVLHDAAESAGEDGLRAVSRDGHLRGGLVGQPRRLRLELPLVGVTHALFDPAADVRALLCGEHGRDGAPFNLVDPAELGHVATGRRDQLPDDIQR